MTDTVPQTANQVLAQVDEDHNYNHAPIDMTTTGGVQKAIERNWQGLKALADYVDGIVRAPDGRAHDKDGNPIDPVTGEKLDESKA